MFVLLICTFFAPTALAQSASAFDLNYNGSLRSDGAFGLGAVLFDKDVLLLNGTLPIRATYPYFAPFAQEDSIQGIAIRTSAPFFFLLPVHSTFLCDCLVISFALHRPKLTFMQIFPGMIAKPATSC